MTDTARWLRVEELFHALVDRPASEQVALLDEACDGDTALRREVMQLLDADPLGHPATEVIRRSIHDELQDATERSPALVGSLIGPWRVIDTLGQGGMGTVYVAARNDDRFEKTVAVKVLRIGLGDPADLARFRRERRILATLEHPGIARLIDGGEAMIGGVETPYIVMELVDGKPITEYCESCGLGVRARVELFSQVLDVMRYAHQQFVLHRDLKPSNIFVTSGGSVKLLDFGIARLIDPAAHEPGDGRPVPSETLTVFPMMTPEYASPEQVRGGRLSVTTDVYSLGVVLYELIAARRPYTFSKTDAFEISRVICEEVPRSPGIDGDIDNIVLKALQKDQARRYASVEEFAEDVRRYLGGRPVLARKDSLAYRAGKFIRRNRWQVAAAAVIAVAITGGTATTMYQARRASARADELQQLAGQLLFQVHDSIATLPGSTKARELLVNTSVQTLDRLSADAGSNAEFALDLAAAYERLALLQGGPAANIGALEASAASFKRAAALYDRLPRAIATREDVLRRESACLVKLGSVLTNVGHLEDAKPVLARAVTLAENAQRQSGAPSIELVDALRYSGDLFANWGSAEESLPFYQRASAAMAGVVERTPTTDTIRRLAVVSFRTGEAEMGVGALQDGAKRVRDAVDRIRGLAAKDPQSPTYSRELGIMYLRLAEVTGSPDHPNLGDFDAALELNRAAVIEFARLAKQDPANARGQLDLAMGHTYVGSLLRVRDPKTALQEYAAAFAILDHLPPATRDSPRNVALRRRYERGYAAALARAGRVAEAVDILRRVDAALKAAGNDFSDDQGSTLVELALVEQARGQRAAALTALDGAIVALNRAYPATLDARKTLTDALQLQAEWLAADPATCGKAREAYDRARALWSEIEAHPISAVLGRAEREAIERRPPACR